jgi:hypothetical protein
LTGQCELLYHQIPSSETKIEESLRGSIAAGVLGMSVLKTLKTKETKMKSFDNFRYSILVGFVAAGTLSLFAPMATLADGKGASQLMPAKATSTTSAAPTAAMNQAPMSCSQCKDGYATTVERSSKGAGLAAVNKTAVHLCPACETKITTTGAGKAKADKVTHTCGKNGSSATSCCTAMTIR